MPLYEYSCNKCKHTFETLVSTRVTTVVTCPECNSEDLEKLIALPAPGRVVEGSTSATNCRGDGPPCGAAWCGRKRG